MAVTGNGDVIFIVHNRIFDGVVLKLKFENLSGGRKTLIGGELNIG
ncbi:MAG: hypothetical protein MK066_14480 [Crocinitomicaceae bacterium]|nr:hypothetical protein [Crocinitomicaceae bacterium]